MSRLPRAVAIGFAAGALVLGAPGADEARAALVKKVPNQDFTGFELVFEARPGERNIVTLTGNADAIVPADRGPLEDDFVLGANDGCLNFVFPTNELGVRPRCTREATKSLRVTLGDEGDRLAFTPALFGGFGTGPEDAFTIQAFGGTGSDVLDASGLPFGEVLLVGDEGADVLTGGIESGEVDLVGGPGPDVLTGGPGRQDVSYDDRAGGVTVTLDGVANDGNAIDALPGLINSPRDNVRPGIEFLTGTAAGDSLTGGDGDESIFPLAGEDRVSGLGGTDILFANEGVRDTILCGPGADDQAILDLQDVSGVPQPPRRPGAEPTFPDCELVFGAAVDSHPTVRIARTAPLRRGVLWITLRCPRALPAGCGGRLSLTTAAGGDRLAARRYARLRGGERRVVALRLRPLKARRALRAGGRLRIEARELDRLGRPKRTLVTLRVRRR